MRMQLRFSFLWTKPSKCSLEEGDRNKPEKVMIRLRVKVEVRWNLGLAGLPPGCPVLHLVSEQGGDRRGKERIGEDRRE